MAMEGTCKKKVSVGFMNDPMPMEFVFIIRDPIPDKSKVDGPKIDQTTSPFLTLHILSSLKGKLVSSNL